ncbi:uncharacterized protein LOC141901984 [Tubulanus polymorphus]|uniref:uncharacterized protein LOC141901984 n=1 Tax=Tubulanus polymorphus TaxID=672921 RepID=UPI003DA3B067
MQREGPVQFLRYHQGSVRGVAFHPKDRYLFCSGAYDGKVNLYSAKKAEYIQSYAITTVSLARNINAVRFTCDGARILATTTARRLAMIDIERGTQILSYDNCAFNGRDRTGLAADPLAPNIAVCCCVNGKGLTLFDFRMPLPLDFINDVHTDNIRDVTFLHETWPWGDRGRILLTAGADGMCKVLTFDGKIVHAIDAGHSLNSVCPTPEHYGSVQDDGFASLIMMGGSYACAYLPDSGIQEKLKENGDMPLWKIRYTSNGSMLYTACDRGVIRRYRRWPDYHEYLGDVYTHKADVEDMDISPYDEYLVTASKDRSVGVMRLGSPNHGVSEYGELT